MRSSPPSIPSGSSWPSSRTASVTVWTSLPRTSGKSPPSASCAPSSLHQLGKKPLAGAKIMRKQGGVAIQDADERYALEIVSFRDHLRADQNIHIACVHPVKEHLRAPFTACAIGVQTRNPRTGEGRQEAFFNALRAASKRG